MTQHFASEPLRELEVQAQIEFSTRTGKVLVQLASDGVESARVMKHSGTDRTGQPFQNKVVPFDGKSNPHQAHIGRRQEQLSDRRIDGSICHVDQFSFGRLSSQARP
jgi:hypothetical protein